VFSFEKHGVSQPDAMNLQSDFPNNFAALVGGEIEKLVAKFPKNWLDTWTICAKNNAHLCFVEIGCPKI